MKRLGMLGVCLVIAVTATVLWSAAWSWAAMPVYAKDDPPKTPAVSDLPLKESVTQYGITWTFDKPVPVGQFITGDYYVVGPVTVKAIDPKPRVGAEVAADELDGNEKNVKEADRVRNGSVLNPPARQEVGWDSGVKNWFRRNLVTMPPVEMKPGDSLVSTISLKLGEKASFPYRSSGVRGQHDNSPTKVAAVLTCVAEPQPPDAFRPCPSDRQQTIYLARNLRRDLLPRLDRIQGAPDPVKFAEVFSKPWFEPGYFGFDQPMENMPHYGQWVGQSVSDAGLLLCMDFTAEQKEPLLVGMVQVGIDHWGLVKSGHPGWEGWGGHGSGRKFPVVLAGTLLSDPQMASPNKAFPKANFGEDNQTMYGDCWTGAKVVFAGHSGVHADGTIPRPKWGPYEHMKPSEWKNQGDRMNYQSEAYRRANSSCCWVGEALTMRLLKLEPQWAHDAFFDYVDRWMTEEDKANRLEINKYFPDKALSDDSKTWFHEGYTGDAWVKNAWAKYRSLSPAPTDGWKKGKAATE